MPLLTSLQRQWKQGLFLVLGIPILCFIFGWVDGARKFSELSISALTVWVGACALEEYKWKINYVGTDQVRRREALQATDDHLFGIFRAYEAATNSVAMLWSGETEEQWNEKANECWTAARGSLEKARTELWKVRHFYPNFEEVDQHLKGVSMAVTGIIQVHQRGHFGENKRFDHDLLERQEAQYKVHLDALNSFLKMELGKGVAV